MKELRTISLWIPVLSLGSLAYTDRIILDEPEDRNIAVRGRGLFSGNRHYRGDRKGRGTYRTGRDHRD